MRQAVVQAIGGLAAPGPNTRVVFCKDTFEYPELEDHELLCNHLGQCPWCLFGRTDGWIVVTHCLHLCAAPKWKGRPRKARKKRSNSPGSESNESESSVSTVTSSSRVRIKFYLYPVFLPSFLKAVLPSCTQLFLFLRSFTKFYLSIPIFTQLYLLIPIFTQFYLDLLFFTWFSPVLLSFG